MSDNVFLENLPPVTFDKYMEFNTSCRENMGDMIPVPVYRLMEFAMREELCDRFGKAEQITLFRGAGYRAGCYFARNMLTLSLPLNAFIAELQSRMAEMKIGVLRMESVDETTGKIMLTVAEDADCSGLPLLGETVCNYDEGFIAGILSTYTGKPYSATEVDCWATGDRVCRFCAEIAKA